MNNPQQDIALIRKYHNGELSPTEKNQLEARALDDPFLQDALDGYEELEREKDDISVLYQRLEERIAPAKIVSLVWGFKQWGIAASILLCIALGSIYFNQTPKDQTIALNDIQQKEDIPQAEKLKIAPFENTDTNSLQTIAKAEKPTKIEQEEEKVNEPKIFTPEPDIIVEPLAATQENTDSSIDLQEVQGVGYATQKKQELTGAVSDIKSENLMAARMVRANKAAQVIKLRGKIVDEKDSSALPGVSIKNLETGVVKQTDANGEFTIEANKNDDLAFNYLGYQTKKTNVQQQDSLLVSLKPDLASLNEVVVVGYGTQKARENIEIGPKVGWKRFKNYLEQQAEIANIGKGKVQVQFVINANGELSNFKIIDSFSAKAGAAAINIIKNYNSGWVGSADKIPHKANITVKFK